MADETLTTDTPANGVAAPPPAHPIEIPGFEIHRELGRGGMARVYLAEQTKLGRLVALKVVTADFARDTQFRQRFLQESRINAGLVHPNIVQLYDADAHESVLYLVMEYVRGGDLNDRLASGMRMHELVRVVRDIGKALDYAHSVGLVHRDIKPENILFREDASAVLTDFGIARFIDHDPLANRSGSVLGTPQYMSPEQAAGRPLDGRSDIYSLGVVFYRMLTGDVPYRADSAVSIGLKHLQEPVPRLPNHLSMFQEVIDRCLAKKPEQRYQSGAELSEALEAIRTAGLMPNATIRAEAVTTDEIRAVGSTLIVAQDPARAERKSRKQRRRRRVRQGLLFTLALVAASSVAYVFVEQPEWVNRAMAFVGLVEDPEVQEAWTNAQALRQDPNQSLASIVSAYRRVLNLDGDHRGAAEALATLRSQWQKDIEQALLQNDLTLAETKLAESAAAFPADGQVAALREALDNRRLASRLLTSTQALLRSHGLSDLPTANAAIQTYQEVLRLAPGDPVAQEELERLAIHYAGLAESAAGEGRVEDAIGYLDRASAAYARLPALDDVRQRIQQATTLQTTITELLGEASRLRAEGTLINPPGTNAAELYHRVLAIDPDNAVAQQGLNEVVTRLDVNATELLRRGELNAVRALVDRASAVGLAAQAVNRIKGQLDAEVMRLTAVNKNLKEAERLLQQGFVTEPSGANAVALLREVVRLDPDNAAAQRLLNRSAERLATVAQEAHAVGMMEQARHYLELALTVTPDVAEWRELRASWEKELASS